MTELRGKVAIVTGASSGIGRAVALRLAGAGVKVALAARRADLLAGLLAEIEAGGGIAISVATDVVDVDQFRRLVEATEARLGPVDVLVNNAGVMYYTLMKNLHLDEWNRQVDVNVKGVLNGVGCVLTKMLARRTGHIVNMSSNAGRKGFEGLAVYSGTKFFVEGLCQGMRAELKGTGVRVTNIQPGDVETELLRHTTDAEALKMATGGATGGAAADAALEGGAAADAALEGGTVSDASTSVAAASAAAAPAQVLQPDDIARAVLFALQQPANVAVNEILVEPRDDPCF